MKPKRHTHTHDETHSRSAVVVVVVVFVCGANPTTYPISEVMFPISSLRRSHSSRLLNTATDFDCCPPAAAAAATVPAMWAPPPLIAQDEVRTSRRSRRREKVEDEHRGAGRETPEKGKNLVNIFCLRSPLVCQGVERSVGVRPGAMFTEAGRRQATSWC